MSLSSRLFVGVPIWNSELAVDEIQVKYYRLNNLLARTNRHRVHHLNVDVEGAEFEILSGIDFSAVDISACGRENNYRDHRIPALMKRYGYRMAAIVGDEFYVREGIAGP